MTVHRKKRCTGCGVEKALKGFYRHPSGKDGLAPKCKLCTRAMVRANREAKAEYYRAKSREAEAQPARRAYKRAYHSVYVKTAAGRDSRRRTQRAYRAFRRATGQPRFPSELPAAVAARRQRCEQRRGAA